MLPRTRAIIILVAYFLGLFFFAYGAYNFINSTTAQFAAPKGTLVRDTQDLAGDLMTTQIFHNPLFIVVQSTNRSQLIVPVFNNSGSNTNNVTQQQEEEKRQQEIIHNTPLCELYRFVKFLMLHPHVYGTHGMISVKSYCEFSEFPTFARQLISSDNLTALIAVDLAAKHGVLGAGPGPHHVVEAVENFVAQNLTHNHDDADGRSVQVSIDVKTTSIAQVFNDLQTGLLGDLLLIDGVALPLATVALALCVRSLRMTIVPLLTVILSVTLMMTILWPAAKPVQLSSFAPDFSAGIMVALSVDYSLFLLTRFRERVALEVVQNGEIADNWRAQVKIVVDTTALTASNIVASSLMISGALGSLLLVPVATVSSIGIALMVGAVCVAFVSLTFIPALLLVFFNFFAHDPVFDFIVESVPCLRRFFADDLLDEAGLLKSSSGNVNNKNNNKNGKKRGETDRDSNRTLDDISGGQHDGAVNTTNSLQRHKSSALTLAESGYTHDNFNNNTNNSNNNMMPSLDVMREREDLIHYRGSTMRPSSASQRSSAVNTAAQLDQQQPQPPPLAASLSQPQSPTNRENSNNNEGDVHSPAPQHQQQTNQNFIGNSTVAGEDAARRALHKSFWYRLVVVVTNHPYLVLLIVAILGAPFCYYSATSKISFDLSYQVPSNSVHVRTLEIVSRHIGTGTLSTPFYVTVDSGRPGGVARIVDYKINKWNISVPLFSFNETIFKILHDLTEHLHKSELGQPLDMMTSIVSFPGAPAGFNVSLANDLIYCAQAQNIFDVDLVKPCLEYQLLFNHTVSADGRMAMILVAPAVDPFGTEAYDYCNKINNAVKSFQFVQPQRAGNGDGLVTVGWFGASGDSFAILHKMNSLLPLQLGLMLGFIAIVCFVVFRSVFIVLRMVLTVAFPVSIALGAGAILFQESPFNKLWPVQTVAYSWLVPSFEFALLTALACDYDLFASVRIVEYRFGAFLCGRNFTTRAAIRRGIAKSGRVISFAGCIMFLSFSGMMFSSLIIMIQFGTVAGIACLLDTFVVRPIVMPALMSLPPPWVVWWPRQVRDEDEDETLALNDDDMVEAEDDGRSVLHRIFSRFLGLSAMREADAAAAALMQDDEDNSEKQQQHQPFLAAHKAGGKRGDSLYGTGEEYS